MEAISSLSSLKNLTVSIGSPMRDCSQRQFKVIQYPELEPMGPNAKRFFFQGSKVSQNCPFLLFSVQILYKYHPFLDTVKCTQGQKLPLLDS